MFNGQPITELILTCEEFDRGYLVWYGATVARFHYQRVRDLPDGRIVAKGMNSGEPTCEVERLIVGMIGSVGTGRAPAQKQRDERDHARELDDREDDEG